MISTRVGTIALLLAAGAAFSCSSSDETPSGDPPIPFAPGSPWPKFRGDAAQTGRSRLGPSTGDKAGKPWKVETAKGIFSSPVIDADGTTFIGSADRVFRAIDRVGTVRWKVLTGEIVDSAAVLDDRGRVYFGSGDGKLRALETATGREIWSMQADDPKTNQAFINWFEGNVAMGPSGTLYVPNDNFFLYALDRDTGAIKWRFRMPDQTWSSPAIDPRDETIFVGNNNVLPTLGKNTFAIAKDGTTSWAESTLGSVAASPMLLKDRMVLGAFDGWVRAYDTRSGSLLWETPTRDHVYASPALLPDGSIVQPSADGTIYDLDPDTGAVRWTFDTDESVRSSPAVDAEGNVYFGGGDGKLWVLRPDGSLRWSMQLVMGDRNDLNASPALGHDGIVIAGESGEIFGIPWDWCLREGSSDARCSTKAPSASDGVALRYVSAMGATLDAPPAELDGNEPLTLRLLARENGRVLLGTLDASTVRVVATPATDVDVRVAGDGKFVVVAPRKRWPSGKISLEVTASWLRDHSREGLRLAGGVRGGDLTSKLDFTARAPGQVSLTAPIAGGAEGSVWELARVALPMPTLMPSYNQIGFDSLHYLVPLIEMNEHEGVAWMIGARLAEEENRTVIDPTTRALFPLTLRHDGDLVTFSSSEMLRMEVMNAVVPFDAFRISGRLDPDGAAVGVAKLSGASTCSTVPFYGAFLQELGLCNPQTDELVVVGGAELRARRSTAGGPRPTAKSQDPAAPVASTGELEVARSADGVVATLKGSQVRAADHIVSLLLVDAATGRPVTLDYGIDTKRELDAQGNVTSVTVPLAGRQVPASMRAHVIVDTRLVATKSL